MLKFSHTDINVDQWWKRVFFHLGIQEGVGSICSDARLCIRHGWRGRENVAANSNQICCLCFQNSEMFETYKNLCCRAFLTLRRNADLIINLFSLVSGAGLSSNPFLLSPSFPFLLCLSIIPSPLSLPILLRSFLPSSLPLSLSHFHFFIL